MNQPIIDDEESYSSAIIKIARQAEEMIQMVVGNGMRLDTITVFSQSASEHDFIKDYLLKIGTKSHLSHGATTYVKPNHKIEVHGYIVKLLGVREPDKSRSERGYVDYPVDDYDQIKKDLADNSKVKEIRSGRGRNLLEVTDSDFDVRAYIVSAKDHI